MSATYIGRDETITELSFRQQNNGIVEYQKKILYRNDYGSISLPEIGSSLDNFTITGVSLSKTDGAFIEVIIRGETSGDVGGSSGFASGALLREGTNSTSEEPIETAVNFQTAITGLGSIVSEAGGSYTAGSGEEVLGYSAAFSEDGEFIGFNKNAKKNFFGVQSYLNPTLSYRRRFSTTVEPSISAVGRIVTPAGDFPSLESGRTWLCSNISYVKRGNSYEVTQEFRGSGRQGWNTYIYGTAVAAPSAS